MLGHRDGPRSRTPRQGPAQSPTTARSSCPTQAGRPIARSLQSATWRPPSRSTADRGGRGHHRQPRAGAAAPSSSTTPGADPRGVQIAGTQKARRTSALMVAPLLSRARPSRARWRCGAPAASRSATASWNSWSVCRCRRPSPSRTRACSRSRSSAPRSSRPSTPCRSRLAGKLDLAGLLDLVGEQIRAVFKADIAYVALLDPQSGIIDFPYQYGDKLEPLRYGEGSDQPGSSSPGKPLIINTRDRPARHRAAGPRHRQASAVVLRRADPGRRHGLGVISVQSTRTEGIYDADDERLLSTHRRQRRRGAAEARGCSTRRGSACSSRQSSATTEVLTMVISTIGGRHSSGVRARSSTAAQRLFVERTARGQASWTRMSAYVRPLVDAAAAVDSLPLRAWRCARDRCHSRIRSLGGRSVERRTVHC